MAPASAPADRGALPAAAALAALGALHVAWAAGSPWPCQDRDALAAAAAGRPRSSMPGPAPSLAVAGLLASAAALCAAGRCRPASRAARAGRTVVTGVLLARGSAGLVSPSLAGTAPAPPFPALNRAAYSPLCLALAALAAPPAPRPPA